MAEIIDVVTSDTPNLTPAQVRHFAALERRIERGLHTFYEVGEALLEIRDTALYRMNYSTFEQYCADKWQLGRQRAYQLMGAAEVMKALGSNGDTIVNEVQARELLPLLHSDPGLVTKVVEAVKASGEPVTAPAIRKAVQTVTGNDGNGGADKPSPTMTDRLIVRIEATAREYAAWKRSRPSAGGRRRVKAALDQLCELGAGF